MSTVPKLIQSLQNPDLFPHRVEYIRLIETHISWVLLTGHYAYKIKKPVNLGFLDFSSLKKRHFFCQEEVRLNSRLASEIYLDVIRIGGSTDQPQIDKATPTIEYAVKMRQFDPSSTFDQLLEQHYLTTDHLIQTARTVSEFHQKIQRASPASEFGTAEAVIKPVLENFEQIQSIPGIEPSDKLNRLKFWSQQHHQKLLSVFKERKQAGYIRECHGDLHLANIALINKKVIPFDGIEFNPSLYWIDVISEVAFLIMDLQHNKRPDLAFRFLNAYLQDSGDYEGLRVLRFYLVYRAMVRAKVSAIRSGQNSDDDEKNTSIKHYHRYLDLATRYIQESRPLLILMHGVSGSGKSWLAKRIVDHCPGVIIRSDVERKRLHHLVPSQRSHSEMHPDLYSQENNQKTYGHLLKLAVGILDEGLNVIVDAAFLQRDQRELFYRLARKRQNRYIVIHTQSDDQTLLQRIKKRSERTDNVSDADQSVLHFQLANKQSLSVEENRFSMTINTGHTPDLSRLWKFLNDSCT